jgi:FkbM family methyltransferase
MITSLKAHCVDLLRPFPKVYSAARTIWRSVKPPEKEEYALGWLQRKLGADVFFIQIGANDGISTDFLNKFVKANKWQGVLVEPITYLFRQLRDNYGQAREGLTFVNKAIGTEPGSFTMYHLEQKNDILPQWAQGLGSFDRNVVLKHQELLPDIDLASFIVSENVEAITVKELLASNGVMRLDLLVIDTEGFDYQILKQFGLQGPMAPELIVVEQKHLNQADRQAMLAKLEPSYEIVKTIDNFICTKR